VRPDAAPLPRALLELRGVSVDHGRTRVLDRVDLLVAPDALVGVVGPSGAGKTTLLRVLLGLQRPVAGEVVRRPGLRVGYVPQVDEVDPTFPLSVTECVLLARASRRDLPWTTRTERRQVDDLLERLGLAGLGARHLRELSGGQRQRVLLARALFGDPHLIVLDEPTSGIDVATRHEVLHLLADLHRDGTAVVLATHDLNGLAAHLPALVCLRGAVVASGPPDRVLVPEVLESTYGAPFEVLAHAGIPVVVDRGLGALGHRHDRMPDRPGAPTPEAARPRGGTEP
jgi:ABC-type Mn2+/Zn2+ transport system ATPase subunit